MDKEKTVSTYTLLGIVILFVSVLLIYLYLRITNDYNWDYMPGAYMTTAYYVDNAIATGIIALLAGLMLLSLYKELFLHILTAVELILLVLIIIIPYNDASEMLLLFLIPNWVYYFIRLTDIQKNKSPSA